VTPNPGKPSDDALRRLLAGAPHDPHSVLGAPADHAGTTVARAYRPGAKAVAVLAGDVRTELDEVADGVFAGTLAAHPGAYRLEVDYGGEAPPPGRGPDPPP